MPESQRDMFRLIWYRNNDLDEGKVQLYRFTRRVWGINSSPFIGLFAIETLIAENPTNTGTMTLTAIENNRYMNDRLLVSDSLDDLKRIFRESTSLFESRGFKLRKWVANGNSKTVLSGITKCDLGSNIREIDLNAEPMPDPKTLGLVWDVENDRLRVCFKHKKLGEVTTKREMVGALAGRLDPLGTLAPCLLEGKLILQKVTILGLSWSDELPEDVLKGWCKWINIMGSFAGLSIPRCCFLEEPVIEDDENAAYQLHGYCDASNQALSCVVYLRRIINGRSCVAFVQGKAKVVLVNQTN